MSKFKEFKAYMKRLNELHKREKAILKREIELGIKQ